MLSVQIPPHVSTIQHLGKLAADLNSAGLGHRRARRIELLPHRIEFRFACVRIAAVSVKTRSVGGF